MRTMLSALALTALVAVGCADSNDSTADGSVKVIDITMADSRYEPTKVTVPKGQEVTFRFTNKGSMVHEALIATKQDQDDHAEEMRSSPTTMNGSPNMGDGGTANDSSMMTSSTMTGQPNMDVTHHAGMGTAVTVQPKESGDITTTFDEAGTYLIGCHQPGHWEAGMKATITVS